MAARDYSAWNPPEGTLKKIGYVLFGVGPIGLWIAVAMGPGTISSLVIAGSAFEYSILWVVIASGWLSAAVMYSASKVCVITNQTPVQMINRYSHWIVTLIALGLALIAWYNAVILTSNVLAAATAALFPPLEPIIEWVNIILITFIAFVAIGAGGGFDRVKRIVSSILVMMTIAFVINATIIQPDPAIWISGLIPSEVGDAEVAFAGIVGGSIAFGPLFYAYLAFDNGWNRNHLRFQAWDSVIFYGILFGIFSAAIYLSAASALSGEDIAGPIDAAFALEPIAGEFSVYIFGLGLWAAAFTGIIGIPVTGAYLVADFWNNLLHKDEHKYQVPLTLDNRTFQGIVLFGCALAILGPWWGEITQALPLMALATSLLTVSAPVTCTIWAISLARENDMGDATGPWYLIVGLLIAGLVATYALFLAHNELFLLMIGITVAILFWIAYNIFNGSDRIDEMTDPQKSGIPNSD